MNLAVIKVAVSGFTGREHRHAIVVKLEVPGLLFQNVVADHPARKVVPLIQRALPSLFAEGGKELRVGAVRSGGPAQDRQGQEGLADQLNETVSGDVRILDSQEDQARREHGQRDGQGYCRAKGP